MLSMHSDLWPEPALGSQPQNPDSLGADSGEAAPPWKVMLVDDDLQVHQVTKLALRRFQFEGRRLSFLSAYSGQEAIELLTSHPDTALILLDIVMETNDAGLQVIEKIRQEIKNLKIQIVVRTGQPGEAPEESVVLNYEINDYRTKLELTQQKLFTTVITSLRAYRTLQGLWVNT